MKISKKILAIALAVIMVLSVLPFSAFATEYEAGSRISGPDLQTGDKISLEDTYINALFGGAVLKAGQFLEFSSYEACQGWNKANGTVTSSDIYLSDRYLRTGEYYFKYVEDSDSGKCYVPIDENGNVLEYILVLEKTDDFEPITFGTYEVTVTYSATFSSSLINDSSVNSVALNSECFGGVETAAAGIAYEFTKNGNNRVEFSVLLATQNFNPAGLTVTMDGTALPVYSSFTDYYDACVFYDSLVDSNGEIYGYNYYINWAKVKGDLSIAYTPTAAGAYTYLKNTPTVIHFNDMDWYLIADNSTSATQGSVTLLAKECVASGSDQYAIAYASSNIQASLDAMTASGGAFEEFADAILSVNLADVNVTSAKLYLPSLTELLTVSPLLLKCAQADGAENNWWWLRSTAPNGNWQAVNGASGSLIRMPSANWTYGVRPALKLDLSKVEFDADTNTFALPSANNGYNLTLDDGINVNFLIDTDFYGAEDGYIEYEYIKSSTTESAEREGGSIDVADLPIYSGGNVYDGDSQLTLKAAPAQIAEDYIIRVYDKDGELKNTLTVSIADYCEKMKNDATYGELMSALLDYGQLANEYFGYADKVEGDYEVPHTENYKAELSAEESAALDSLAVATIVNQGEAQVTGVSYIAQMNPEFKFFFTGTSATTAEVSGDLRAKVDKTNTGATVKVTGLNASDFGKTFTVTMDGTTLEYNGYAYLKAAMNSAALKDLAKGIFRYAQAADKTFN